MLIFSFIFILICIILGYCLSKGIKSSYELLDEMEKEIHKK